VGRHAMFAGDIRTPAGRWAAWFDSIVNDHGFFRLAWDNFAPVVPGRVYRCNHPTPGRLAALKRRYGLRTVVNLRGQRRCGSDALSREAARQLGLAHIDMAFESRGAPHRERILRFHAIYTSMQTPALLHCKSGADRAGLAAGLVVLFEGGTAREALRQLSLRFGHVRQSRTGVLDAFFLHYAAEGEGRKPFLDWVREDYDEEVLRATFRARGLASFLNDCVLGRE
jgi:protein tyrosine/serine phosphatase